MSWEEKNLESLCEEITVGYVSSMANEYTDKGIPFLRSLNIEPYKLNLKKEQLKFISETFHRKLSKSKLNAGDLAIVRTGLPGTCCVIPKDFGEVNCSDLVIARPKKSVNPYFLCYYINSPFGKGSIGGNLVGVAQKHFNVGVAKRMLIPTPPLQTQKRIADILSAYDDLIENNLKRIKLLEQAAQNIYKEWFVNLRFPGYEDASINEETGLPEGWEEVLLNGKALYFGRGVTPKYKVGSDFYGINQKVNKGSILDTQHMKEFDPESNIPENKYAHFGDVLINSLGEGTIGRIHFYSGNSMIHAIDQHISIFRSENLGLNLFIYLFFSSSDGQGLLSAIKKGGTNMTMLNIGDLRKLEIKIPSSKMLLKLKGIALPFFKNKNVLINQNKKLKAARDILLPRLMNRTIEV